MTATACTRGHKIEYRNGAWTTPKTDVCARCGKAPVDGIDACIAPIVAALQAGGVPTVWSCCGHGRMGEIMLADGRLLRVPAADQDGGTDARAWALATKAGET